MSQLSSLSSPVLARRGLAGEEARRPRPGANQRTGNVYVCVHVCVYVCMYLHLYLHACIYSYGMIDLGGADMMCLFTAEHSYMISINDPYTAGQLSMMAMSD